MHPSLTSLYWLALDSSHVEGRVWIREVKSDGNADTPLFAYGTARVTEVSEADASGRMRRRALLSDDEDEDEDDEDESVRAPDKGREVVSCV